MHLDEAAAATALRELARVTRAGGIAVVTAKARGDDRVASGYDGDRWFWYWDLPDLVAVATGSGWQVEQARLDADSRRDVLRWCALELRI